MTIVPADESAGYSHSSLTGRNAVTKINPAGIYENNAAVYCREKEATPKPKNVPQGQLTN